MSNRPRLSMTWLLTDKKAIPDTLCKLWDRVNKLEEKEDTVSGIVPIYGPLPNTGEVPVYGAQLAGDGEVKGNWYGAPTKGVYGPRDVGEIVGEWLYEHGYEGLCGDECGCYIDDLFPCCDGSLDCVPAYNNPERAKEEGCSHWMQPDKPKEKT